MPQTTVNYAALRWLNSWLEADSRLYHQVSHGTHSQKLEAVNEAATRFRIARNLSTQYDTSLGLARYQPALAVIDNLTPEDFVGDLTANVLRIRDKLKSAYGGRNVLSATTKLLWLKLRSPIIIYDQQARDALGTRPGDLESFYDEWRRMFELSKPAIVDAVASLVDVLDYTVDPQTATRDYVLEFRTADWFLERVFDTHLWNLGNTG
jgi:hypothetical protein